MRRNSIRLTEEISDYIADISLREPEVLRRLREETARVPMAGMQIAPDQGQFMALLARLVGARRCLEVGTFTGYSALVVALALPLPFSALWAVASNGSSERSASSSSTMCSGAAPLPIPVATMPTRRRSARSTASSTATSVSI